MTAEVGKVAIRAIPSTKGFRQALKRAIERDTRVPLSVNVRANIDRATLDTRRVRASIQDQFEKMRGLRVNVEVDAHVRGLHQQVDRFARSLHDEFKVVPILDRVAVLNVNREIQKSIKDISANIDITSSFGDKIRREVNALERELLELNQMTLFDNLSDGEFAWLHHQMEKVRHEINRIHHAAARADDKLDEMAEDRTVRVDVNPFTAWATARLKWLTRPRFVDIIPKVPQAALTKAATSIAALTGARLTWNYFDKFSTWMSEVDKKLPRLTFGTLGLANAFSAVMGSIAGIVGIGDGLFATLPSLLLIPGLLAGAAMSGVAMVVALKHSKEELDELGPSYTNLGKIIRSAFWDDARPAIISLSKSVMPQLERSFDKTSRAIGRFTAKLASSFEREFGEGRLEAMFDGLATSWDRLSTGTDAFARAITNLGLVAARYMPQLADWFVRQSITFDNWLAATASDGRLDGWIKESVEAFYSLWDVLAATTGIFQALWGAAEKAGYEGLRGFANMLLRWEKAVQGAKWQDTLVSMFRGSPRAMQELGDGLAVLGDTLHYLRDDIEYVLSKSGSALGDFIANVSRAFQSPVVSNGMRNFVDGIAAGLDALGPALGPLADMFGTLASFAGLLAANLGPVLGKALEVLAPLFTDVLNALAPLLPQLSESLIKAITDLTPLVADLTQKFIDALPGIVDFVSKVIEAAPELLPLAVGLVLVVAAVSKLVEWLSPLVSWVTKNAEEFGKLGLAAEGVVGVLARFLGWVGIAIALFASIWSSSERFRDSLGNLGDAFGELLEPIGEIFSSLTGVEGSFDGVFGAIGDGLSYVNDLAAAFLRALVPALKYASGALGGFADALSKVFKGDFAGAAQAAQEGIQKGVEGATESARKWLDDLPNIFSHDKGAGAGRALGEGVSSGFAGSLTTAGADLTQFSVLGTNAASGFYAGASGDPGNASLAAWAAQHNIDPSVFSALGTSAASGFFSGAAADPGNASLAPWVTAPMISSEPFAVAGGAAKGAFEGGFTPDVAGIITANTSTAIDPAPFSTKGHEAGMAFIASLNASIAGGGTMIVAPQIDLMSFSISGTSSANAYQEALLSAFAGIDLTAEGARIAESVATGMTNGKGKAVGVARSMGSEAQSALSSAASGAYGVGVNFGAGFAQGMRSQIGAAARSAASLAASAMRAAKAELDIHSPSRRARDELGGMVGRGYALGLERSIPMVQRSMRSMVDISGQRVGVPEIGANRLRLGASDSGGSGSGVSLGGGNSVVEFNVYNPVVRDPFEDSWNEAQEKGLLTL